MKVRSIAASGLVLCVAIHGAACAEPAAGAAEWLAQPSFEDKARAYPHEAFQRRLSGESAIRCSVRPDGSLADCFVASEMPTGLGFGSASLALADRFRMKPEAVDRTSPTRTIPFDWTFAGAETVSMPNYKQLPAHYPDKAKAWNINALVRIRCRAMADGTVSDCFTFLEAPRDFGFASASLDAVQHYRMRPDGALHAGGVVEIALLWRLGDVEFTPVFEVGDNALLVTFIASNDRPTRNTNPVFTCASADDRRRNCEGHPVVWWDRPSNAKVWRVISETDPEDGETRLSCSVGESATLSDCRVVGKATPRQEATMRKLAAEMKPAPEAVDGVSVARGRINLSFDWWRLKFLTSPGSARSGWGK